MTHRLGGSGKEMSATVPVLTLAGIIGIAMRHHPDNTVVRTQGNDCAAKLPDNPLSNDPSVSRDDNINVAARLGGEQPVTQVTANQVGVGPVGSEIFGKFIDQFLSITAKGLEMVFNHW